MDFLNAVFHCEHRYWRSSPAVFACQRKPELAPGRPLYRAFVKALPATAIVCLAVQFAAQTSTPTFPDPGKPSMSRQQQRALGLQTAAEVYKQMPVLPDSSLETQYVRQLGQRLVSTIPAQYSWPFDFHVVAQKEINAFALPGGPMFINIGTITSAANEAQLAGVMAHEMSHVYMQHSAKQAGKAQTTSLIAGLTELALGATVGDKAGGLVGQLGEMGIQFGAQGMMLKYSRTDESQADAVGAVILNKAGYNPQALADFFKALETQGGKTPPQWLSDHPNPGNRELAIQKEIQNWPPVNYTGDSPAFAKVRAHATGVRAYTAEEIAQGAKSGQWVALNKKNGATFNPSGANGTVAAASLAPAAAAVSLQNVAASERMVTADLGPIKLDRPENWTVTAPEQKGQFLTIAPPAGATADGIGYGVLLNGIAAQQLQGMNIDQVTAALVKQMQQNQGAKLVRNALPTTVGGLTARSVVLQSQSPFSGTDGKPQTERDLLLTVPQRDGSVIFMVFVAPEAHFAELQPTFQSMIRSAKFR